MSSRVPASLATRNQAVAITITYELKRLRPIPSESSGRRRRRRRRRALTILAWRTVNVMYPTV